jgi:predicted nucleic-acid-binding protein
MKSLDANIVIRFLVNDDKRQGEMVKKLFIQAEKKRHSYFVSHPVLLEVLYVLDSVYEFSRTEILDALESMISMAIFTFENKDVVKGLISTGRKENVELEDLLIGLISKKAGCESTITFDRKAARSDLFELLS